MDKNTGDCVESDLEEESEEETDEESESKTAFIQDDRRRLASESGVSVDDTLRVLEWLFALSCQFVAQVSRPSEEASLPLVHFIGVLGIYSYNLVY